MNAIDLPARRFGRPFAALALALACLFSPTPLPADERKPVTKTPVIAGRPIERFVLLGPIVVPAAKVGPTLSGFLLLAGQYVPTAEDANGVYYQSLNGLRDGYGAEAVRPGGVWVSKKSPGVMHPYSGTARGDGEVSVRWQQRLSQEDMKQFRLAQTEKAPAAKK